jgi:hypothetical protein
MTMKKTLRVLLATDGVPVVVPFQELDKTRELPAYEASARDEENTPGPTQAAPRKIVADDITVSVHSSIESTLTFELLRLQSTEADEDEDEDEEKKR